MLRPPSPPPRSVIVVLVLFVLGLQLLLSSATSTGGGRRREVVYNHHHQRRDNGLSSSSTSTNSSSWRVWTAVVCVAAAATLSSAGGLGGGGLYVPIFNLLLGFDSKTSAALSSCTIVGGILVNVFFYSFQSTPSLVASSSSSASIVSSNNVNNNNNNNILLLLRSSSSSASRKPLIDYQVALLCLPNLLLGIAAGVIFNVMSPGWLVTATLVLVLSVMTSRSFLNAMGRWSTESSSSAHSFSVHVHHDPSLFFVAANDQQQLHNGSAMPLPPPPPPNLLLDGDAINPHLLNDIQQPLLALDKSTKGHHVIYRQFPPFEIILLTFIWLSFLAVQVLRGSSDGQNLLNIVTCGTVYWIITFCQVPLAILLSIAAIMYLGSSRKTAGVEQEDIIQPATTETQSLDTDHDGVRAYIRDAKSMTRLSGMALASGVLGGMLGLGGGMIISPLFIEMGMHPQVTAATCSFMVFFSSSLSVVQYWLLGRIPEEYALISALIAFVFSIIGLQLVQSIIIRYGRDSLIVFCVSTVMGISAILMAGFGSWDVWIQIKEGDYMGFEMPC